MTIVKEIEKHFSTYPVFTYRDIKLYFSRRKVKDANLTRLLSHMKSSNKLYTLRKGVYTFRKDDTVSGFSYSPFYYGLLSAMTIRDFWTQNSRPDILTIKKIRNSSTYIFDDKDDRIFVHHIPARYFFGFDIVKYGSFKVPVSDAEKTLIDLFYYRVKLPIQEYSELLRAIRRKKLMAYLKPYNRRMRVTVINFVRKYKAHADAGELQSPY